MKSKIKKLISVLLILLFGACPHVLSGVDSWLRPVALLDRGNNNYGIYRIANAVTEKIAQLIKKHRLTDKDLNNIIWALSEDELPRDADGEFQLLTDEEIYRVIEMAAARLAEGDFAARERVSYSKGEALFQFREVLIDKKRSLSLIIQAQDRLIDNLSAFFLTADIEMGEFPVFLARDALTAGEFLRYCGYIIGRETSFASVYQPGMSRTAVVSDYMPDSTIDMVQKAADLAKARTIGRLQAEGKIPQKPSSPFYDVFHPVIYAEMERLFMEDLIHQWKENPLLLREAEILFRQMVRNGVTRHRNIVLMDMAVTGKTILYVKTVLRYFCEKNSIDIGTIRIFVGYSHDKKMCLPEVRLFDPTFDASGRPFRDQVWPFYRTGRDGGSEEIVFKLHEKKVDMLMFVYRSLKLYNAALRHTRQAAQAAAAPKARHYTLSPSLDSDLYYSAILRPVAMMEQGRAGNLEIIDHIMDDSGIIPTETDQIYPPEAAYPDIHSKVNLSGLTSMLMAGATPAEIEAVLKINPNIYVTVVDIDRGQLERIQRHFSTKPRMARQIALHRADMAQASQIFGNESFDFVALAGLNDDAYRKYPDRALAKQKMAQIVPEAIKLAHQGGYIFHINPEPAYYKIALEKGIIESVKGTSNILFRKIHARAPISLNSLPAVLAGLTSTSLFLVHKINSREMGDALTRMLHQVRRLRTVLTAADYKSEAELTNIITSIRKAASAARHTVHRFTPIDAQKILRAINRVCIFSEDLSSCGMRINDSFSQLSAKWQPPPDERSHKEMHLYRSIYLFLHAQGTLTDTADKVLSAMALNRREDFVLTGQEVLAYEDVPIVLADGQPVSQPAHVAHVISLLNLTGTETVREIGTGSGWLAAIAGELAKEVITVEIRPALANMARANLAKVGKNKLGQTRLGRRSNIEVVEGDGAAMDFGKGAVDRITISAGIDPVPESLIDALKIGGIMIVPTDYNISQDAYMLKRGAKAADGKMTWTNIVMTHYVPLVRSGPLKITPEISLADTQI